MRKPKLVAAKPATQDDDGRWLCNVDHDCTEPAVVQVAVDCHSCRPRAEELQQRIDAQQQRRDSAHRALEVIREALTGGERPPSAVEREAIARGRDEIRDAGAVIGALEAERDGRAGPHTHPVFGCEKHGREHGLIHG